MQIIINLEKKHLYFVVALVCVLFIIGVNAYVNPTTGVGHDASETGPGTFGGPGDYTFPNVVFWNGLIPDSKGYLSAWPDGEGVNTIHIGSLSPSVPRIAFWNSGSSKWMDIFANNIYSNETIRWQGINIYAQGYISAWGDGEGVA
ncbi:hypothetical protein KY308_01220, partial [Candidatus Woesearchaeota archaeon]|nr:hypothetical protein [Candidatus Woesearchaeota archaeon]